MNSAYVKWIRALFLPRDREASSLDNAMLIRGRATRNEIRVRARARALRTLDTHRMEIWER